MSELEDDLEKLVRPAIEGDRRALQQLIDRIYPSVLRYARARLSPDKMPTAEDVAQEICLAVATRIPTYVDTGKPFMAFVYRIAFHKVSDVHRFQARDHAYPAEEVPERTATDVTPEEHAVVQDRRNEMRRLLDSLGDKAREIIILRVLVGLSAEETATVVGSSPGAVRVAQHRALKTLRKALEQEELG